MGEIVRCERCKQTHNTEEGKVFRFTHSHSDDWWVCLGCLILFYNEVMKKRMDHFFGICNEGCER